MSQQGSFERGSGYTKHKERIDVEKSDFDTLEKDLFKKIKEMRTPHAIGEYARGLVEQIVIDINSLIYISFKEGEFEQIVELGRRLLGLCGVREAELVSSSTPAGAVAIAGASNLAAKTINPAIFYTLKPALIVAAWKLGAEFGLGDDGAYYLSEPITGTESFHNPDGEIEYYVKKILHEKVPVWEHPWSGVPRQDEAFDILDSLSNGAKLASEYAETTLPSDMKE